MINKLNKESILKIKEIAQDKDIIDDSVMEELKKLNNKVSNNNVALAILYTKCFTLLDINLLKFSTDDEDYSKQVKEFIYNSDLPELRRLVNEYGSGEVYGDYIVSENIKLIINKDKEKCMEVIRLFWAIFGGDE